MVFFLYLLFQINDRIIGHSENALASQEKSLQPIQYFFQFKKDIPEGKCDQVYMSQTKRSV